MSTTHVKNFINTKSSLAAFLAVLLLFSCCSSLCYALSPSSGTQTGSVQPLSGYTLNGSAPADLTVLVNIAVPLRNTDQLSSLAKQVSDPSSPMYRHFLTSTEIEQQFLPKTQYETTMAFLQDAGLSVVSTALDSVIVVSASAAQVKEVLHTDVTMYNNGSQSYYMASGSSLPGGAQFLATNITGLLVKPNLVTADAATENGAGANVTYTHGGLSAQDLPAVYNATALYGQGYLGENQTIGILDFYGSPTIYEDLDAFNRQFGFPDANLTVVPFAPYNPNLGAYIGWSTEVALDVEMAHAMAPKANLELYVTTGALTVAADIANIVDRNTATTVSMSLSFAFEWQLQLYGGPVFLFNMFLADQFFMLGSLQGITFLAASGDAGGCGHSSGPAGNSCYPSDSPYVTSVGGTQTYIYTEPNGSKTAVQTGWSNRVNVPDIVNAGGGGGGVSFLEPKPWYQQNQETPPSYPNGRMEPDLSLQGGIYPGIWIVDAGSTFPCGGTSASAPILAGFVALMAQATGAPLGLINPLLYSLGNNESLYTKAYTPITFGYIVPWTASYGYNMVTGWGAPNIGQIVNLIKTQSTQPTLSIDISLMHPDGSAAPIFTPNQIIEVTASITKGTAPVTSGAFTAKLVTLTGTALETPLTFDAASQKWFCTLVVSDQSGVCYVDVNGSSQGVWGQGTAEIFAGYIATFFSPSAIDPWTTAGGLQVTVASTDLFGNLAPVNTLTMQVNSYSILNNAYDTVDTVTLTQTNDTKLGLVETVNLTAPYPAGPTALMLQGSTYGFLPFTNGIYLQNSLMYPEVYAEPGSLAPGQYLKVVASPIAPKNIANVYSYETGYSMSVDIAKGSNVTVLLVNPQGVVVANSSLVYSVASAAIVGSIQVPANATSGLYTVLLKASYGSLTLGCTLNGLIFGQVWVSNGLITPQITLSPSKLYMGQTAQVTVDLRYPNGQEVTQGIYTAIIYPQQMQDQYSRIMRTEYVNGQLTPLSYNSTLNRWVGAVKLPSPYDAGVLAPLNASSLYYAGPYEAYVTGISYDGVPTTAALSAQQSFYIQPYVYVADQVVSSWQQTWGLALSNVTINGSTDLSNNVFVESNFVQSGTTTISDSIISGTLYVTGCSLTLQGVHGGNIVATDSNITLVNSDLAAVTLVNSYISLSSSSYQTITPAAPTVQILSPSNGGTCQGNLNVNFTLQGNSISSVKVYLNGESIQTFGSNGSLSFTLPTANYPDGTYQLQAVAAQTDGITASANVTLFFSNQYAATQSDLNNLTSGQTTLQNQIDDVGDQINDQINNQQNQLNGLNSSQTDTQNQLGNLQNSLNDLNQTQPAIQSQIGNLGDSLNGSIDALQTQIADLNSNLKNSETLAFAGIVIGVVGVAIAVTVLVIRRPKPSA
jgi:subtilase family serine protease